MELRIRKCETIDCLADFYCGMKAMDDFIHSGLHLDVANKSCVLYGVYNEDEQVVAVFALSNDALYLYPDDIEEMKTFDILPKFTADEYQSRFKEQRKYPSVDISHLAVHKDFRGQGIGRDIITAIINRIRQQSIAGCQFVTVDAYYCEGYNTSIFYDKCKFIRTGVHTFETIRMYTPIQY